MIIKSAHVSLLKAPLARPFRIATGQHDALENVLLTLTLADGTKGFGEAAVATHITGETVAQTVKNLKIAAVYLKGQDIGQFLAMSAYMHTLLTKNMAALAAVEMALHDAVCRHLRMPLWRLWGTSIKPLATDITIVVGPLQETVAAATQFYRQGFRHFKIKIGRNFDEDIKRVAAVAAIAPRCALMLDANQGFSAQETLQFLKQLYRLKIDIRLIEQPVPKADWEGLRKVTRLSKVLVCADESVSSLPQAVKAIKDKAVGAINIKVMKSGLVHGAMIARLAKAHGIKLMIGGMMESSLAMTASAHLAAGVGGFDYIDLDTPFFIKGGLTGHPALNNRGIYDLTGIKAGIGIIP